MSPRLRTHLVTAGLFAAVILVVLLVWSLRSVFVWVLLGIVALLVYWGLYLLVSTRLRTKADEDREPREGE
jgi:fatty acid desaturase